MELFCAVPYYLVVLFIIYRFGKWYLDQRRKNNVPEQQNKLSFDEWVEWSKSSEYKDYFPDLDSKPE